MTSTVINIQDILKLLPHRYPFILIDKVLEYDPGKRLIAIKNVTINEPFFNGHFPVRPVMPGVLILEALAQASCLLNMKTPGYACEPGEINFFASADQVRFKRVVEPGDQLRLEVNSLRLKPMVNKAEVKATVDGDVACSAILMSIKRKVE